VDKKVIDLMARLDPEQARRWSGKTTPDEPTIDQLVESDLDEAFAQLATKEKYAACREMNRLARKLILKDKAKALRLAEEMAVQARSVDPKYRIFSVADAGRLLAQLGRADAGRKLVEDAGAQAEKMATSDEWARYVRGFVAGRLAPFDLPRAKKLLDGPNATHERSRYAAMCANALATSDPKAATEMLELCEKGFERGRYAVTTAYLMAPTNLEAAVQIVDRCSDQSTFVAQGYAWIALAIAPQNKAEAHRLIDRAFQSIHDRPSAAIGWGTWSETAGTVALCALAVGYPERAALTVHVFAERSTDADMQSDVRAVESNVALSMLLAAVDRAAARTLLDAAERRKDVIGGGGQNVGRREYLTAWGFIDPIRGQALLLDELEQLKRNPLNLRERCPLLDALSLLTTPASGRARGLGRMLWTGWPDPEEIE
jgi:hypothetical protein